MDLDGAKYISYYAAWKLSEGLPATTEVSMAKSWVGPAYHRICKEGHQIHGGIGVITDHDMPLYFRRAKAAEIAFGNTEFHQEIIARQMGLP